jgi:short subunit dehydrogenase-like uncharacterized protein
MTSTTSSYEQQVNKLINSAKQKNKRFMLYGATGYTAKLIIDLIVKHEAQSLVVVAGRDESRITEIAKEKGFEHHTAFQLNSSKQALVNIFKDWQVNAVLLTAGPFTKTAKPVIDACLTAGVSYLDITGEIDVFEYALSDKEKKTIAENREIYVIPGVGFDVVPSDCLAARVANEFKRKYDNEVPHNLDIAIRNQGGGISRGTLKTVVEQVGMSGGATVQRKDSKIVQVPMFQNIKQFQFEPSGTVTRCTQAAWGDVSTAFYSTSVPNISVYFAGAPPAIAVTIYKLFMLQWVFWFIFKIPFVVTIIQKLIDRFLPPGPAENKSDKIELVATCKNKDGSKQVTGVATSTAGYLFTADAALLSTLRVLNNEVKQYGCITPSLAFGADYLAEMDDCTLHVVKR